MGEQKRTQGPKVAAMTKRLNAMNQQLYLAVAELAVYRVMAGPMDQTLYRTIMGKLEGKEFTDVGNFFENVTQAAKDRMVELDIVAEQQEKAAAPLNPVDQLLSQIGSADTSTPSAED